MERFLGIGKLNAGASAIMITVDSRNKAGRGGQRGNDGGGVDNG